MPEVPRDFSVPAETERGERQDSIREIAEKLNDVFEDLQPERVNPRWISKNAPGLYARLLRTLPPLQQGRDWSAMLEYLDAPWKKRWTVQKRVEADRDIQQEVAALTELLEQEKPKRFGPGWIQKNDRNLAFRISKAVYAGNKPDWTVIIGRLDHKWQSRWTRQDRVEKGRSMEQEIGDLKTLLEAQQPEHFGPKWIQRQDQPLYFRLTKWAQNESGQTDWAVIIDQLDSEWQKRWGKGPVKHVPNFDRDMRTLQAALEEDNPDVVRPLWIQRKSPALYARLQASIRNDEGGYDWSHVEEHLDEKWRERWTAAFRTERGRTLEQEARALTPLLESLQPDRIHPRWIEKHAPQQLQRLYRKLSDLPPDKSGLLDWSAFVSCLDPKWQKRWTYGRIERTKELQDDVDDLTTLLEKERPKMFNPGWIRERNATLYNRLLLTSRKGNGEKTETDKALDELHTVLESGESETVDSFWLQENHPDVYKRLTEDARDKSGSVNWDAVLSRLDAAWSDRWRRSKQKRIEDYLPEHLYADKEEVERAVEPFRDDLYTMLTLLKPKDAKKRDVIFRALISLAQKGNEEAESKIISFMEPSLEEWMERYEQFTVYKYDRETAIEAIRRCIYYFDAQRPEAFHAYAFRTLQLRAIGLKRRMPRSLDQAFGDDDTRTLYDILELPNSDDED